MKCPLELCHSPRVLFFLLFLFFLPALSLRAMLGSTNLDVPNNVASPAPTSFWQRNWPRVFILFSIAVVVLTFLGIIFNFLSIVIKPNVALLNVYCLVFSLLTLSAELRQFPWCRTLSYHWMKYTYFLTYYTPRGLFYIFLGLLLLGDSVLLYVAGAVSIVVGVVMLVTNLFVGLPVYDDPQERRREQEEARRYYEGSNAKPASLFAKHLGAKEYEAGGVGNANEAHFQQYQPPSLPIREGGPADLSSPALNEAAGRNTFNSQSSSPHKMDSGSGGVGAHGYEGPTQGSGTFVETQAHFAGPSTTDPEKAGVGGISESQLRRDFAAAMSEDNLQ